MLFFFPAAAMDKSIFFSDKNSGDGIFYPYEISRIFRVFALECLAEDALFFSPIILVRSRPTGGHYQGQLDPLVTCTGAGALSNKHETARVPHALVGSNSC